MIQTKKSSALYVEMVREMSEMGGAPCENAPDMFFIDEKDPLGREKMRISKALCSDCPIKMKCLAYALEAGEVHGIWGGLTTNERRKLTRNRITGERLY
jgi:WhiB family redox-sensing transcriptional regulator